MISSFVTKYAGLCEKQFRASLSYHAIDVCLLAASAVIGIEDVLEWLPQF
jgi:hypothetical protein